MTFLILLSFAILECWRYFTRSIICIFQRELHFLAVECKHALTWQLWATIVALKESDREPKMEISIIVKLICQFGFFLDRFNPFITFRTRYANLGPNFSNNDVRTRIKISNFVKPVSRSQYISLKVSMNICFDLFVTICA